MKTVHRCSDLEAVAGHANIPLHLYLKVVHLEIAPQHSRAGDQGDRAQEKGGRSSGRVPYRTSELKMTSLIYYLGISQDRNYYYGGFSPSGVVSISSLFFLVFLCVFFFVFFCDGERIMFFLYALSVTNIL